MKTDDRSSRGFIMERGLPEGRPLSKESETEAGEKAKGQYGVFADSRRDGSGGPEHQ